MTNLVRQLRSLPDRLSYSVIRIESPTGLVLYLPKRELFDIRVQLLGEGSENDEVIDQLDKSDLRSGVYEGGFKTWECALDLASLLLDRGPRKDIDELIRCDQVIEVCRRSTCLLQEQSLTCSSQARGWHSNTDSCSLSTCSTQRRPAHFRLDRLQ